MYRGLGQTYIGVLRAEGKLLRLWVLGLARIPDRSKTLYRNEMTTVPRKLNQLPSLHSSYSLTRRLLRYLLSLVQQQQTPGYVSEPLSVHTNEW